ncbi:agmatine deiminase family protein [bacterium]|nr:agmatine deiminase family protein [bacterium]
MKIQMFIAIIFLSLQGFAKVTVHGFTPAQSQWMAEQNAQVATNDFINGLLIDWNPQEASQSLEKVPFAEYSPVGYVIISEHGEFDSLAAKKQIAQNLPDGVTLVVFTGSKSETHQKEIYQRFSEGMNGSAQLKVVYLPGADRGFWARDGVPVPVWSYDNLGQQKFAVVDAKYYHGFEADKEVSDLFSAQLLKHNYYHEGGNFLANSRGECLVVNNERAVKIPDQVFLDKYGCKKTIRFPHTKGIGHIDETVKLINDDLAITDDKEYASILQKNGFTVQMVPRPKNSYETYVNSLYVNGTLFLPTFKQSGDAEAVALYESFGYKVVSLDSRSLSNDGLGSIHCITMAYPPVPFNELLAAFGAQEVKP